MNYAQFNSLHWQNYQEKYSAFFQNFSLPTINEIDLKKSLQTASAVFSSNIEGNTLDLNSFSNAKLFGKNFPQHKEEQEIEDLIQAYIFAEENTLTEKTFLQCHKISSSTLLPESQQGKYRNQKVGVFGKSGLIYMAVEEEHVEKEMKILFEEIDFFCIKNNPLSSPYQGEINTMKIFFFASYIHLRFVHIHPFMDGNGRMARILEKWIIANCVGKNIWSVQTEEIYKNNRQQYYDSINIGVNFYERDYNKAFPFLSLLPNNL